LRFFGFEGWHSQWHVHAVAASWAGGRLPGMDPFIVRGVLDAAGTKRRLDINVTIEAHADDGSAELGGTAYAYYRSQHADCCGHQVS